MKRSLFLSLFLHVLIMGALLVVGHVWGYSWLHHAEGLRGHPGSAGTFRYVSVFLADRPGKGAESGRSAEARNMSPASVSFSPQASQINSEEISAGSSSGDANGIGRVGEVGEGGSGGIVDDSRLRAIRERLERQKYYPELAWRRGISGLARVQFRIDDAGKPQGTKIIESSGSEVLDQAVLRTVERGSPYPPVSGVVTFPLRFDLAEWQGSGGVMD